MLTSTPWLDAHSDHCILRLRIQPGAKRSSVVAPLGDQLKIAVQAPPVDGKANEALLSWIAEQLGVKKGQVTLVAGQASRDKRVRVQDIDAAQIRAALGVN